MRSLLAEVERVRAQHRLDLLESIGHGMAGGTACNAYAQKLLDIINDAPSDAE